MSSFSAKPACINAKLITLTCCQQAMVAIESFLFHVLTHTQQMPAYTGMECIEQYSMVSRFQGHVSAKACNQAPL
jgi:hypothetical protein